MALHHLVQWVTTGVTPPRAERIEVDADGYFVKDEHGNSKGGVFNQRLEELLRRGWLLPEDAPNSRAEAVTQRW